MAADSPDSINPTPDPEEPSQKLPTDSPQPPKALAPSLNESSGDLTSVMILQENALRDGKGLPIEQLSLRLTNASASLVNLLTLVCNEITQRMHLGHKLDLMDYQRRYPQIAAELGKQWFARALKTDGSTQSLPPSAANERSEFTRLGEPLDDQREVLSANPPIELLSHVRYRLIRQIGQGGMGSVWLAMHVLMNRPVAVKVIRTELLSNYLALARFQREVQAAARLNHPNVATAFDAEQIGDTHFLVIEFVEGETLAHRVAGGKLAVCEACQAIRDAANGMSHAHAAGLVHRDIKPGNLIRSSCGTVKVLDFGLVIDRSDASSITGNSPMGTTDYISPEQIESPKDADARSDIYSLGCTLYHLLTGKAPFAGLSPISKFVAHRDSDPAPIPGISSGLQKVVAKMMAKLPENRYQTAEEVVQAISPFCDASKNSTSTASLQQNSKRMPRRIALAAFVSVAAGLLAYLYLFAYVYKNGKNSSFNFDLLPDDLPRPPDATDITDNATSERRLLLEAPTSVVDDGAEHMKVSNRHLILRGTETSQVWIDYSFLDLTNLSMRANFHLLKIQPGAIVKFTLLGSSRHNSLNFKIDNQSIYLREDISRKVYEECYLDFKKELRSAWTAVDISLRGNTLTVLVDGEKLMEVKTEPTGTNNIAVSAQHCDVEVHDLRVIKLD